uniref:FYVE-type domain-containing protein n=1 Tax=Globisporangium ultimum (strain ATCC 200006 / CBS 805.95 / DAOM BR144) TaxID=431595 RepID=K3W550_GLOUD
MAGEGEYAPKRMDAIKLAKGSKWEELKKLVDAEPLTAQQIDSYGMLPLHWACTEPHSISETVLMSLLKAFPQGARATNTAEMLPLQIAIKAQAKIEWLQALLASYPDAVLKKAPSGENAVQLARKSNLPARSVKLLEEMYHHVCEKAGYSSEQMGYDGHDDYPTGREDRAPGQHTGSSHGSSAYASSSISGTSQSSRGRGPGSYKSRAFSDNDYQLMNTTDLYRSTSGDSFRTASVSSVSSISGGLKPMQYQPNSRGSSRSVVSLPPRWTIAPNCHICSLKFGGPFKKRHHCRNCGQSICGDHSARERMRLPHYGLSDRHRVCTVCHDLLRNGLTLQLNQPRTTQTQMLPNRRSDEAVQRLPDAPNTSYQLERHVSAPARPSNLDAPYNGIHDQVASLQKQVSILMEEKELAESQLRAQTELLNETLDPERLSRRGSGRDRLNSFPVKLSSSGSSPAGTSTSELHQSGSHSGYGQMYNSYEAGGKMMQRTNSSGSFRGREVDIDRPSTDVPPPVPVNVAVPEPVASSSPVAPLQDEFASVSLVESTYSDESEERPTEGFGDLHDADETYDSTQEFADDDEGDDGTLPEIDVMVNLGLSMMDNGMVSAAVQAFARAVDICPNDATLHSYLGRAYYADDNLDDAVIAITKSLELEPSATNSTLLGKILFEKGDHEKAIEAYQKSLEIQQSKD